MAYHVHDYDPVPKAGRLNQVLQKVGNTILPPQLDYLSYSEYEKQNWTIINISLKVAFGVGKIKCQFPTKYDENALNIYVNNKHCF